jgi:uncharacterized protein YxjI
MKFYIKQKAFSIVGKFKVKDETGRDVYTASGKFSLLAMKLNIYEGTNSAVPVARIEQKLMSLTSRFRIIIRGQHVTDMVRKITMFSNKYELEGLSWHLTGNFRAREYKLMNGHETIMQLSRKGFLWGESYELDIADNQDPLLCLCISLAVDCCNHVRSTVAVAPGGC